MAQLGSFVPAEFASVRIADKLFTRLTPDDKIEANASSFMLEMQECAYALQDLTDRSLIIVDELGRGTSTQDGVGITYAISEKFILSKAFTFFATHFKELCQLDAYPTVVNYHMATQVISNLFILFNFSNLFILFNFFVGNRQRQKLEIPLQSVHGCVDGRRLRPSPRSVGWI